MTTYISENYQDILLQTALILATLPRWCIFLNPPWKHDTQVSCITLWKFECLFFWLKLFWNPNVYFPRAYSGASLWQHPTLLFKWNSLFSLWVQESLAVDATASWRYRIWAITVFGCLLLCKLKGQPAQVQSQTRSPTWKKHQVWITKLQIQAKT